MEVNLAPDLDAKLARLATERGRDKQAIIGDAIERLVDYDEWFVREVENGLAAADRAELVDPEEVRKLIGRILVDAHPMDGTGIARSHRYLRLHQRT